MRRDSADARGHRHGSSSGSRCAAGRSNRPAPKPARRTAAKWSRCCATSPERKQQEQALEDARAEAERANAAKSRFLATMSHELRTPLNAIIGFSEMLKKEAALMLDAKRRNEYAGLINDSGNHLLSVVNGILDMSKIETDNFEITPEPFTSGAGHRQLLRHAGAAGARGRRRARAAACPAICRRSSPTSARSTRSCSICCRTRSASPTAAARSLVSARAEARQHRLRGRGQRRRHQRRGFGAGRRAVSSRPAPPTTAAMAAPVSGFPSSKAWCGCMAANSRSAAASARAPASPLRLPLDCERSRPAKKRSFGVVSPIIIPINQSAGTVQPAKRGEEKCVIAATIEAASARAPGRCRSARGCGRRRSAGRSIPSPFSARRRRPS